MARHLEIRDTGRRVPPVTRRVLLGVLLSALTLLVATYRQPHTPSPLRGNQRPTMAVQGVP